MSYNITHVPRKWAAAPIFKTRQVVFPCVRMYSPVFPPRVRARVHAARSLTFAQYRIAHLGKGQLVSISTGARQLDINYILQHRFINKHTRAIYIFTKHFL
ncbi:hypothetical protein FKM82_006248 [Ascaphus truei]